MKFLQVEKPAKTWLLLSPVILGLFPVLVVTIILDYMSDFIEASESLLLGFGQFIVQKFKLNEDA